MTKFILSLSKRSKKQLRTLKHAKTGLSYRTEHKTKAARRKSCEGLNERFCHTSAYIETAKVSTVHLRKSEQMTPQNIQLFAGLTAQIIKHKERKHMATKNTKNVKEEVIKIEDAKVKYAIVTIEGDGDLVLNKMNASNERTLLADDRKAQALWEAQHKNKWEDIITSMHWRDGIPCEDTNSECTEEMFYEMLEKNAPCITAFGLKKSWGQAVTRNEIDKYATKFDNAVNVIAPGGLIPITFADWKLDTRLMTPKRGAPITTRLNHFQGWRAEVPISYTEHVYSINEIATIINYAGFGLGIGSGRSSGYGRYHVVDVK